MDKENYANSTRGREKGRRKKKKRVNFIVRENE
jgi:hypothetical protein